MSKIRMDFARNEVSDGSFICLDPVFFTDNYKSGDASNQKEETKDAPKSPEKPSVDFSKLSGALQTKISQGMRVDSANKPLKRPPRVKVTEDDFGFASESSEDDMSAQIAVLA